MSVYEVLKHHSFEKEREWETFPRAGYDYLWKRGVICVGRVCAELLERSKANKAKYDQEVGISCFPIFQWLAWKLSSSAVHRDSHYFARWDMHHFSHSMPL